MTHFDGDTDKMPVPSLDDRALEALLSGARSPQAGFDWLVPFVEDLGEACSEPAPVVRPALALLLAEGFSTGTAGLPATGTGNGARPAPAAAGRAKWSTKLRGIGLAAKAGLGLALIAASTTAAGAAGVLPDPAQHAVATVVEAATPFSFPDAAADKARFGGTVSNDATGASDGVPGVDGKAVSDAAKRKHDAVDAPTPTGTGRGSGANPPGGVGANTGATGLDRANETPAAGHPPTSVPVTTGPPAAPGSPGSKGLATAGGTPAADNVPTSVPATPGAVGGRPAAADRAPAGGPPTPRSGPLGPSRP